MSLSYNEASIEMRITSGRSFSSPASPTGALRGKNAFELEAWIRSNCRGSHWACVVRGAAHNKHALIITQLVL